VVDQYIHIDVEAVKAATELMFLTQLWCNPKSV